MTSGCVAAVDLGATSGRVMIGRVGPEEFSVEAVHRFPNQPVRTLDGLHWNILELTAMCWRACARPWPPRPV